MWLHIVEKFVSKRFYNLTLRSPLACRSSGLSSSSVIVRWAAVVACHTEMVKCVSSPGFSIVFHSKMAKASVMIEAHETLYKDL